MTGAPQPPGVTSPAVERAVALLLGADEAVAHAAVDALVVEGRLGEGIALHALLLAAREGTDAAGALGQVASGAALPTQWSAYEHRTATEEAGDEIAVPAVTAGEGPVVVAGGADAPTTVLLALRDGAGTVCLDRQAAVSRAGLAPEQARCDLTFTMRLSARAGAATVGFEALAELAEGVADEGEGDETAPCEADYIDVLAGS